MNHDFIIHAGWLINGKNEPARRNVFISIRKGIIQNITKKPERDGNIINMSSNTIIPGLIDSHVHLTWSGTDDSEIRKKQINYDFKTAKENIENNLDKHLSKGIVAVRDGGDKNGHTLKYKNEFHNNKIKISSPGYALHKYGRYGSIIGLPVNHTNDLLGFIKKSEGIDHIKIVNSGLNSLTNYSEQTPPQFTIEELTITAQTAKSMHLGIMVHANGEIPVKEAIEAGSSSIEHGFFMGKDNLKRMADNNIFWVPTAVTMKAYSEHISNGSIESDIAKKNLYHQIEQISLAREYGVSVVLGTDAGGMGVEHGESLLSEMEIFTRSGYSIIEAVHCATGRAADLLKLHNMGRIESGIKANIVSVPADPDNLISGLTSDITVFIEGKEISINELQADKQ